jgi:hypothetical protein
MKNDPKKGCTVQWFTALCSVTVVLAAAGCSTLETPATADVAVTKAAVDNAAGAGAQEFAPVELNLARQKLAKANQAMAEKNYRLAMEIADEARADAKLAQAKAGSSKAQKSADALQDDIRVLREELNRVSR